MRRSRRLGFLLGAVLLAVACDPAASPSPSPGAGGGWEPRTPWERAVSQIDDTGHYSLDTALRLFSIVYGPLPGVDGDLDRSGVTDRTIALDAIQEHWNELTAEQQTAVEARRAPSKDAVVITIPPVSAAGDMAPVAVSDSVAAEIKAQAQIARAQIAGHLGLDFDGDLTIRIEPRGADVPEIAGQYPSAETSATYADGVFASCQVTIYEEATIDPGVVLTNTIAHELFHCFQRYAYQTDEARLAAPLWVKEGQAAWAGQTLGGPSPKYDRFWEKYLVAPTDSLTARSYDAIGFYAHLAEVGQDPWSVFQAMWDAGGNNIAIYQAAEADAEVFVDSWASGVVRQGGRGSAWDTTGPGITTHAYVPPGYVVENGTTVDLSAPFFTNEVRALSVQTDLLAVRGEGHLRLNDFATDAVIHDAALYCIEGHDCTKTCPGGDPPPTTSGTIKSEVLIASSGSFDGTIGEARGLDLDEACESQPPSPPPSPRPSPPDDRDPCQTRCAESNGDVHISTFGDYGYDFQGVGEFVLARSSDGQFEVQTRQAPLGDSKIVSINTALAVRSGDQRVALYVDTAASSVRMTVNGSETPFSPGEAVAFGKGGIVAVYPDGVRIDTGDGSHVYVIGISYRGFNLLVEPGEARAAGIVGLMGPNPTDSRWPALPDGSAILPFPYERHAEYEQLYVTLADAWRVTPESSLFDYAPGESTQTFTRRPFPAEADLVYLDDLTEAQRAAGEAACANVPDPVLHKMCVYDVGITADAGYGEIYEQHLTLLETGSLGISGERLRVVNLYANEGVGAAVDVYAWAGDATNLGTNSGTGPALVTTVPYGQASEWFNPGKLSNGPFTPVNWITIARHGQPLNGWQLNLFDLPRDSVDGLSRTLVIASDPDGFAIGGGTAIAYDEIREDGPGQFDRLFPVPPGKSLAFLDVAAMFELRNDLTYAASIDGRCLADPEFPTLAHTAQGPNEQPVLVEPGTHEVALHAWPQGADEFDLDCSRFPVAARTTVTFEPNRSVLVFPYALSETSPISILAVPVGG